MGRMPNKLPGSVVFVFMNAQQANWTPSPTSPMLRLEFRAYLSSSGLERSPGEKFGTVDCGDGECGVAMALCGAKGKMARS